VKRGASAVRLPVLIGTGAALLLVGGYGLLHYRNEHARGRVRAMHLVFAKEPLLLVEESLTDVGPDAPTDAVIHLLTLRPPDGWRVARVSADVRTTFVGGTSRGLWFDERGGRGLHRRDPQTLEVNAEEDDWRSKVHELPPLARVEGPLDPEKGIPLRFADGKVQWLDPDSMVLRPAFDAPVLGGWKDRPSVSLFDGLKGTAPNARIGRLHGQAEVVSNGRDEKTIQCSGHPRAGTPFYSPGFILLGEEKQANALDGPQFLLAHRATPAPESTLQVSRVDCAGAARWTVVLPGGAVGGALIHKDLLFIVTRMQNGEDRLDAVSLDDGTVKWSYPSE